MKRFSKSISLFFLVLAITFSLVGCATKPQAEVSAEAKAPEASAPVTETQAPAEVPSAAETAATPAVEEKPEEPAELALDYKVAVFGYEIDIAVTDGHAVATYPVFITDEEIADAAAAAMAAHPEMLAGVIYWKTEPGTLEISFDKGLAKSDVDYIVGVLSSDLEWYVAQLVESWKNPPLNKHYTVTTYGVNIDVTVEDGKAVILYPMLVTDEEVAAAAYAALAAHPQLLEGVTYAITGDGEAEITFQSGLTEADIDYIVGVLSDDLEWYVGQLADLWINGPAAPTFEEVIATQTAQAATDGTLPFGVTTIVKDDSGESEFSIYVIHTNDVHARVEEGTDGSIGYAKFATLLKMAHNFTDDILLLDAGDVIHGTNFANLLQGASIMTILDMLGYDAVAPGNHDFNYGYQTLVEAAAMADAYSDIKVLNANILGEDGELLFQPYQTFDFNGFTIAVIGLTTPDTVEKAHPKYTKGLTFLGKEILEKGQAAVDLAHEYADFVIVLGHIGDTADGSTGLTSDLICQNINGIDLFIDGHSHTPNPGKVVNGALIVQADQYLNQIGLVEIVVKNDEAVGLYSLNITADDVLKPAESPLAQALGITEVPADAEILAYVGSVNAAIDEVYAEVVATIPYKLEGARAYVRTRQTDLSRLVCQAITAETGADFTITNGGGIRASLAQGDVTIGDINSVLPFTNTIAVVELTGKGIYEALEYGYRMYPEQNGGFAQTDLQVVFNPKAEAGHRIVRVYLNGVAIEKDDTVYHCATNDFLAAGGDGYTMMGAIVQVGRMLNEVLIDYMKEHFPVAK
ncbi:MAG: 5'-nucleotidase C-terminal domain-containing protein [Spirochaetales bacterium]|nr:5'-nucleotidase C-terminal domain-containing protein [Spirochaetales bacterium]